MPALLKATKRDADGKILDQTITPFNDFGVESVQMQQEHDRLKAAGYEVEIIRQRTGIAPREGKDILT